MLTVELAYMTVLSSVLVIYQHSLSRFIPRWGGKPSHVRKDTSGNHRVSNPVLLSKVKIRLLW